MYQLSQIILIMLYLISIFILTDEKTRVVYISEKAIDPIFIALFSITFGIIISIISFSRFKYIEKKLQSKEIQKNKQLQSVFQENSNLNKNTPNS